MYADYEPDDEHPILRFKRELRHPVDAVWRAVTEPEELAQWFPTTVELDPRPGGQMKFTFPGGEAPEMRGEVIEFDPPHRFAFTWGEDRLSFELESRSGDECVLRFEVVLDSREKSARDAAGWHACLDALVQRLDGESITRPMPTEAWRECYEEYRRRGLPADAPIPG
jgi:uncharacterized protein YndB with AHSA1/START domain